MTESPDLTVVRHLFADDKRLNNPKLDDDAAFERFVARIILKHYGASSSALESGLVSGKDDGGIDGFYVFLNKREIVAGDSTRARRGKRALLGLQEGLDVDVIVIQAKKETSWDSNVFGKIQSSLTAMFDEGTDVATLRDFPLNEAVIEAATVWRSLRRNLSPLVPRINFYVYYLGLGRHSAVSAYMHTKASQLRKWLEASLPTGSNVTVEYVGDAGIVERHRANADYKAKMNLKYPPIREGSALVGMVSIGEYLSFLRKDGSSILREELFAFNVRDYAGKGARVNSAIAETLGKDSESEFWWLNNGITIIADEAKDPFATEWHLTNPLIVNGLQTSHVIHEKDLEGQITRKRKKQCVLVRVVTEGDPMVREAIIRGTNNQTAVAGLQLHANDELQTRIEEYLKASGWYYERRRYQYRGIRGVPASRVRSIVELGQAVIAYRLLQPDTARARPASLLGKKDGWTRVFDPQQPLELYLRALGTVEAVDDFLRSPRAVAVSNDRTNPRYYLVAGAVLRASGVRSLEDFHNLPTTALAGSPSVDLLAELHALLYAQVEALDERSTALDQLFKGSALAPRYFERVLEANGKA